MLFLKNAVLKNASTVKLIPYEWPLELLQQSKMMASIYRISGSPVNKANACKCKCCPVSSYYLIGFNLRL